MTGHIIGVYNLTRVQLDGKEKTELLQLDSDTFTRASCPISIASPLDPLMITETESQFHSFLGASLQITHS